MVDRPDPYRQFRFKVTVGGTEAHFSEVTVAETTVDPIDYREGIRRSRFRKISGLTKYGNITSKREPENTKEFYEWVNNVHLKGSEAEKGYYHYSAQREW